MTSWFGRSSSKNKQAPPPQQCRVNTRLLQRTFSFHEGRTFASSPSQRHTALPPSLLELLSASCQNVTRHQSQVTGDKLHLLVKEKAHFSNNPEHSRLNREQQQVTVAG